MNEDRLEQQLRQAFDSWEVPAEAKQRTLEVCDRQRKAAQPWEPTSPVAPSGRRRPWRFGGLVGAAVAACLVLGVVFFGVAGSGAFEAAPGNGSVGASSSDEVPAASAPIMASVVPTAYVAIDINPSLELSLDQSDTVVGASGVNQDGWAVLGALDLEGMAYGEALRTLGESQAMAPYLTADSYVQLSITTDDVRQEQGLAAISDEFLATLPCGGFCAAASHAQRQEASAHGMGCGRYQAAQQLMALDSTLTWEDCEQMSLRELRDRLFVLEGGESVAASGQGNGSQGGYGAHGVSGHHGQGAHHGRSHS